jgi:hypothetical protein
LFIERRFIQPSECRSTSFLKTAAGFCSVCLALAGLTHATFLSRGFTWRLPKNQPELAHLQSFPARGDMEPIQGPVRLELFGDSLTEQYAVGLSPLLKDLGMNVDVMDSAGCPILYGVTLRSPRQETCRSGRDQTFDRLNQTYLPVIYVQRWSAYDDAAIDYVDDTASSPFSSDGGAFTKLHRALSDTIDMLIHRGHRILIIGEQPSPDCAINRPRLLQGPLPHAPIPPCLPTSLEAARKSTALINQMLTSIQSSRPDKVALLLPISYFCDTDCPVTKDGVWLYFDRAHLTLAGAKYFIARNGARLFRKFIEETE